MEMKNTVTPEEISNYISKYKKDSWALIYMLSEMILDKTDNISFDRNWDELLEARFFNEEQECHIFKTELGFSVIETVDTDKKYIDGKIDLENKHFKLGKTVVVRQYINFDEDGQAFVEKTRLVEII